LRLPLIPGVTEGPRALSAPGPNVADTSTAAVGAHRPRSRHSRAPLRGSASETWGAPGRAHRTVIVRPSDDATWTRTSPANTSSRCGESSPAWWNVERAGMRSILAPAVRSAMTSCGKLPRLEAAIAVRARLSSRNWATAPNAAALSKRGPAHVRAMRPAGPRTPHSPDAAIAGTQVPG
jgi:hypothetical protein